MAYIEQVTANTPDGATVAKDGTIKAGFHGAAVVQADYIATVTVSNTITVCVATLNSILTILADKGLMAAS
jgi:hypothetical protein